MTDLQPIINFHKKYHCITSFRTLYRLTSCPSQVRVSQRFFLKYYENKKSQRQDARAKYTQNMMSAATG